MGARFLTRDPLEALTRSAYGYAGNDPINQTDPTGMCPWCIPVGIALVEVGFSLWDAYDAYTTFNDDCAGGISKASAGGFFLLGLFAPGGGYGALDNVSDGRYLFDNWYRGTFENRTRSVGYHVAKHGGGRTAVQYTRDAQSFFAANRHLATRVTLRDGTEGYRIRAGSSGGFWTLDGRVVSFWD